MSKSHERQIRHIKDVFPGADVGDDYKEEKVEVKENVDPHKPQVVQSSTSGVFFGSSACLDDIHQRRRSSGGLSTRKKRQAPRPPVLVDIDVGFADQGLLGEPSPVEEEEDTYQVPQPAGSGSVSPTPAASPADAMSAKNGPAATHLAFANSSTLGQESNKVNPLFDDTEIDGHGSLNRSSSGIETDDNNSTPSEPTEPVAPERRKRATMGFPSPPPRRPRTPPARPPPPDIKPVESQQPSDDKPPKPEVNGYHTEQEYDANDSFEEEEFTVDFEDEVEAVSDVEEGDELLGPERRKAQVYPEYKGDDYSQYLNDDEGKRKGKRRLKKRKGPKKPTSPSNISLSSTENTARKGLKLRMGQMFAHPDPEKGKGFVLSGSNIHNFTFADSKIGNDITDNDLDANQGTTPRRFEKNPNAQTGTNQRRRSASRWWNKDTLSAQSLSSHSDILLKPRRSSSIPDIYSEMNDTCSALSDPTYNATDATFRDAENSKFTDFESYRKNLMYDTKNRSAAHVNLWRRLSRNLRRGSADGYGENTTSNPLSSPELNAFG